MHEIITSASFWFYSVVWFVACMFLTPPFEDWNWKQAVLVGVVSGPVGWILSVLAGILTGFVFLWELLGKK